MDPNVQKPGHASGARKRATSHPPAFDTIKVVQHLKDAGFGEKQAMTMVETLRDAQSELATKADLERTEVALRTDLERTEVALRSDMEKMEVGVRSDMEKMEAGIRSGMEKMEAGIRNDMEKMEAGIRSGMEKMEAGIRSDMEKMEAGIRSDMEKVEFNLRADTMALRNEMNDRFATLYWRLLIGASIMVGILGTLITLTGAR